MSEIRKKFPRFFTLCAAGLLLTAGLSAQQKDWAQFGRYAQANKTVETPVRVVFMGNSITDNWWAADSLFFLTNRYVNRGIGGQTTAEMLVRFRSDVLDLRPQVVVILAGTNDIAGNNGYIAAEHTFGNIVSMVELARAHDIRVVLCSVLPAYDFPWRPGSQPAGKIVDLNRMIRTYAVRQGIPYVDYHSALKDNRDGMPERYSGDGVHPNLKGYKIMEPLVKAAVEKMLK